MKKIYEKISELYGEEHLDIAIKKLDELKVELNNITKNKGDLYEFIYKVAEVDIIIQTLIYGYDIEPAVETDKKHILNAIKAEKEVLFNDF